jgi:hypothetical protein
MFSFDKETNETMHSVRVDKSMPAEIAAEMFLAISDGIVSWLDEETSSKYFAAFQDHLEGIVKDRRHPTEKKQVWLDILRALYAE